MQDPASVLSSGETWADEFAHALDQQRCRAEQFLADQRQRLQQVQSELGGQVQRICEALELARSQSECGQRETDERKRELDRLSDHLHRLGVELEGRQAEWEKARSQVSDQDQGSAQQADSDFLRCYEKVHDEARELRGRVQELEQQLARRERPAEPPRPASGGVLNWEAEKRRILARLEAETAEENEDEDARRQRLEVRAVVVKTDRIIADKQAEIDSLQQVLQSQTNNLGSLAVGAAAVGQLVDKDPVIREERENLLRLKQQWEQRMRKSEIETSIERASIARQRAELEARIKEFESRQPRASSSSANADPPDKPVRGRWLARLGLKE
jgi:hypothetical protein